MKLRELASLIAKREGKKSQALIGDIREILNQITSIECEMRLINPAPLDFFEGPISCLLKETQRKIKAESKRQQKAMLTKMVKPKSKAKR
jgi:hypothetical protein